MFSTKRERESFPTLQSAEPVAIESLNQIARSLVRSSHTTVRAHSQGENNQTNERASARPSALRPSVRPSVRRVPNQPTKERIGLNFASLEPVPFDASSTTARSIDRRRPKPATETRETPRARRRVPDARDRARACVSFSLLLTVYTHNTYSIFPSSLYFVESRIVDYPHLRIHSRTTRCPSLGRSRCRCEPGASIDRAFSRFDPRWVKLENTRCRSREGSPARQRATGRDAVVG